MLRSASGLRLADLTRRFPSSMRVPVWLCSASRTTRSALSQLFTTVFVAIEKYPDAGNMPSGLIFELILNLAEAGNYERATALFKNRFFPREEGGTNVRPVWIEVQLQRSLTLANQGRCAEALDVAEHFGSEVAGLAFTRDGLEPILKSART